jgi:hypothetical protein
VKLKTFRAIVIGGGVILLCGAVALCVRCSGSHRPAASSIPLPSATSTSEAPGTTPATTPPAAKAGVDLRPMDHEILARIAQPLGTDHVKDAFRGRPYKVSLYQDAGHAHANRVKVDLNRNEKWDEKWTVDLDASPRVVKREVSTADDETYDEEWRLDGETWVKKLR